MNRLQVRTEDVPVAPRRGRYRKTAADVIVIWRGFVVFIPAGFLFDGASLPFYLWWWCSPWTPWVVLAACVHDYLYGRRYLTRRECDRLFLELLIYSARKAWPRYKDKTIRGRFHRVMLTRLTIKARIMYAAVRVRGDNAAGAEW